MFQPILCYESLLFSQDEHKKLYVNCARQLPEYAPLCTDAFELLHLDDDKWAVYSYKEHQWVTLRPGVNVASDQAEEVGTMLDCLGWLTTYYRETFKETAYLPTEHVNLLLDRHIPYKTSFYYISFDKNLNEEWGVYVEERESGKVIFRKEAFTTSYYAALDYFLEWVWESKGYFITASMVERYVKYLTFQLCDTWEMGRDYYLLWNEDHTGYVAAHLVMDVWRFVYTNPGESEQKSPILYGSWKDVAERIAKEIAWHGRAQEFGFKTLFEYLKEEELM